MKTLLIVGIVSLIGLSALAESPYKQGEVTVETFAVATFPKEAFTSSIPWQNDTWGYGAGVTYFFHRNFGLGAETVVLNGRDPSSTTIDEINLNLTWRFPIQETGLAPYVTAGGGRNIENGEYLAHGAVGLEYRFTQVPLLKTVSVFAEARYQWVRGQEDAQQFRSGIKFAF